MFPEKYEEKQQGTSKAWLRGIWMDTGMVWHKPTKNRDMTWQPKKTGATTSKVSGLDNQELTWYELGHCVWYVPESKVGTVSVLQDRLSAFLAQYMHGEFISLNFLESIEERVNLGTKMELGLSGNKGWTKMPLLRTCVANSDGQNNCHPPFESILGQFQIIVKLVSPLYPSNGWTLYPIVPLHPLLVDFLVISP